MYPAVLTASAILRTGHPRFLVPGDHIHDVAGHQKFFTRPSSGPLSGKVQVKMIASCPFRFRLRRTSRGESDARAARGRGEPREPGALARGEADRASARPRPERRARPG